MTAAQIRAAVDLARAERTTSHTRNAADLSLAVLDLTDAVMALAQEISTVRAAIWIRWDSAAEEHVKSELATLAKICGVSIGNEQNEVAS